MPRQKGDEPTPSVDQDLTQLADGIRGRAYELFEEHGRQDGHDVEDWLQAEAEVTWKNRPHSSPTP